MKGTDSARRAAIEAVVTACHVARTVQARLDLIQSITKDDRSPVTVADFAVQAIISIVLAEQVGDEPIVGEENTALLRGDDKEAERRAVVETVRAWRSSIREDNVLEAIDRCNHDGTGDSYWALDPIDGTKGFLRGQQYAIALGRLEGGRRVLGVLGCPNLPVGQGAPLDLADRTGSLYAAEPGMGAWEFDGCDPDATPRRLAARTPNPARTVRFCESVERAHSKQSHTLRIADAIGADHEPVRLDSQCKYALIARGQVDAYLRMPTRRGYIEKIWDHAAGSLIATEAGAVVSDINGLPLDFSHGALLEANTGILCAAPGLHDRIIEAIAELELGSGP